MPELVCFLLNLSMLTLKHVCELEGPLHHRACDQIRVPLFLCTNQQKDTFT